MISLATVRPPRPESNTPIGEDAVTFSATVFETQAATFEASETISDMVLSPP